MIINKMASGLIFIGLVTSPVQIVNAENYLHTNTIYNMDDIDVMIDSGIEPVFEEPIIDTHKLTQEDVDLISRVVMAEAEDEPYDGKIYVIDTILNRVDSKHFPKTVRDVIYQRSQFTSMWNGRYNRCTANHKLDEIIQEEYKNRRDNDIVFFTADHYAEYGRPSFRVGNHYFSNY